MELVPWEGPVSSQCSTTATNHVRLALKLFRGERAITEFDWPFTPILSSSKKFLSFTGSGLHSVLPEFHPGQG